MVYNIISAVYSIIGASDFNLQGMPKQRTLKLMTGLSHVRIDSYIQVTIEKLVHIFAL